MNDAADLPRLWLLGNQAFLLAELSRIKLALARYAARTRGEAIAETDIAAEAAAHNEKLQSIVQKMPAPPAIATLGSACALSPFERDLILLCAGVELDTGLAATCAQADGRGTPSFALALMALEGGHWSALSPDGTLRRLRLIELLNGRGETLAASALRIEERVLHYLTGVQSFEERLEAVLRRVPAPEPEALPASQQAIVTQVRELLRRGQDSDALEPLIWLCGADARDRRSIAAQVCSDLELSLYALRASELPSSAAERQLWFQLWERECYLSDVALLVAHDDDATLETARATLAWLDRLPGVVFLSSREPLAQCDEDVPRLLRIDVPRPAWAERAALWRYMVGRILQKDAVAPAEIDAGLVEQLAAQFRLGSGAIGTVMVNAASRAEAGMPVAQALWESCRQKARPRLDDLARRIEPQATWDVLVLPDTQRQLLRQLVAQQRQQAQVYHRWGMGTSAARGQGLTALFAGQSGTGKTLAAEVLAGELGLDLYHIDLSQIISKYIGETEKNLRRVFDAAEDGGAVLLFDEADALFGKRSEVKDSHDRYANIEVSYLLQRMESYQGASILTSNQKSALDSAFLRRIRFIIQFPFPDAQQRAELWRRAFPAAVPVENLSLEKLARLNVTGGQIRNISLCAAFLAADEDRPVSMRHLLEAARSEYMKTERPLTDAEIGGWL